CVYTLIYTPLKLRSRYATEAGSLAGSMPVLVGYSAVRGDVGVDGWILGVMVTLWQMPHFFAITLYRFKDYQQANVPVLPVASSLKETKLYILGYIIAFTVASMFLYIGGYLGALYGTLMMVFNTIWMTLSVKGFFTHENGAWAKQIFQWSLITILALTLAIIWSF
ncbi:MAG: UbiA family prenyltransferase, partial [Candidatus Rhabdochlamydia sp.]